MTNNSATEAAAGKADLIRRLKKAQGVGACLSGDPRHIKNLCAEAATALTAEGIELASLREREEELEEECREIKQLAADNFKRAKVAEARAETAERERDEARTDAERYRYLRERDLDTINKGGIFAGMTPKNIILNLDCLDREVDAARAITGKD